MLSNEEYLSKHNFSIKYEDLNKHNNHAGDCLIKAIMFSRNKKTEQDWLDIHKELFDIALEKFTVFNDPVTMEEYFDRYGYKFVSIGTNSKIVTAKFLDKHCKGNYIIGTHRHCFAYVDGIIYDDIKDKYDGMIEYTLENSKARSKVLWYAKKIESEDDLLEDLWYWKYLQVKYKEDKTKIEKHQKPRFLAYTMVFPEMGSEGMGGYYDMCIVEGYDPYEVLEDFCRKNEFDIEEWNKNDLYIEEDGKFYYGAYFTRYFLELPNKEEYEPKLITGLKYYGE